MIVRVNFEAARTFGERASKIVSRIPIDPFTDPRYYPPPDYDREIVTSYFLVMVAMDHRLSRPHRPYEGVVDGEFYHGADLLYRLGVKKLREDPDFFTSRRLSKITIKDILNWLSLEYKGRRVAPPDPELRAMLLRDIGVKLETLFDGEAYNLILASRGHLKNGIGGFINLLKVFVAYQDPVEKKAYLLAKFLERRRILEVVDHFNKEVPVDNHLTRIALRLGIVEVDDDTLEAIAAGRPFTWEEDVMLRMAARIAYKEAARAGGMDPFILDDFLWLFGRKCCTRDNPLCRRNCSGACKNINACGDPAPKCAFSDLCKAFKNPLYMVPEHNYLNTWYY
ncbi:MAG: hypothetical protein LRS46_03480 [Desulfurococcales archaeon]|nr:hypothetical protein [Desulfurococcales archaeon]